MKQNWFEKKGAEDHKGKKIGDGLGEVVGGKNGDNV